MSNFSLPIKYATSPIPAAAGDTSLSNQALITDHNDHGHRDSVALHIVGLADSRHSWSVDRPVVGLI
jgi:hypothetical protein